MTRAIFTVCLAVILVAIAFSKPQEDFPQQPMPYEFEYRVDDGEGSRHGRQESGDESGTVKGWYSYNDPNGVYRRVDYVADRHGFRAHINTNEPGTKAEDPADVQMRSIQPPASLLSSTHSQPQRYPSFNSQPHGPTQYY